jgi:hypothetical protein
MKFNSMKEYFSRLSNTGYQLMMVPLLIFILYYAQTLVELSFLLVVPEKMIPMTTTVIAALSVLILTVVQLKTAQRAKKIAKEVGLGIKLEKLADVLVWKMRWLSAVAFVMPVTLLLSGSYNFSIGFVILFAWYFVQCPSPARVSRLLKLKGDERKMVITKGEAFR